MPRPCHLAFIILPPPSLGPIALQASLQRYWAMWYISSAILVLALAKTSLTASTPRSYSTHDYWVLEHNPNGPCPHDDVAQSLGAEFEFIEQVGELRDHYLIRKRKDDNPYDSADPVLENLYALRRRAAAPRVANRLWNRDIHRARGLVASVRSVTRQVLRQRTKRWLSPAHMAQLESRDRFDDVTNSLGIHDPTFDTQWHLLNVKNPPHDMNVSGVWEMGITGKGVISAIVDDGLDMTSDDLAANYVRVSFTMGSSSRSEEQSNVDVVIYCCFQWAAGSWDYNDHVPEPVPRLSDDLHGTRCAGEIAAVRNDVCGVGVAYDSKVSGIRILSGGISDADEAAALNYGYNETAIYSCSWGPPDDGRSMEAPSALIQKAVLNGIENGRQGKGSIFVFASGNGAGSGDQCNFDGYTNSIYSVTVSAIDSKGMHPYYSEPCAANMIVAYSSGGGNNIVSRPKLCLRAYVC